MNPSSEAEIAPRVLEPVSVPPSRLAHVVFRTNQLDAMVEWYVSLLLARIAHRSDAIAFLAYDDEHHRLALIATATYPQKPAYVHVGFYHAAFSYQTLGDLLGTYLRLKDLGIVPYRTICHGPTMSFYYRDPDANDIELQVDAFETPRQAEAWMMQEQFAANPIGVDVDADDLVRRYRAGEADSVLLRRADRK